MKKLLLLITAIFWMLSFTFAETLHQPAVNSTVTTENLNSQSSFYPSSGCIDWNPFYETYHYYLWDNFYVQDSFYWASNDYAYVFDTWSRVIVIDPYSVFHFNNSFKYISNWKPITVPTVKFTEISWYFKTWTLISSHPNVNGWVLVWQLVFNLHRRWFRNAAWAYSYNIGYYPMPNWPQSTTWFSNYQRWADVEWYECFNYIVHYCWDGVVDTQASIAALPNWKINSVANEECDPNAPWWNSQTCNPTTCQIIQQQDPQCHSKYNWQITYTNNWNPLLNSWSSYLCAEWTPANFTGTWTFWTWRHFTWQCTVPWKTPVNCSANQIWCWDWQINSGSEMCESYSETWRGWCNNNCTLKQPECIYNLTASPNWQPAPQTVEINKSYIDPNDPHYQEGWGRLTMLYFGDWQSYWNGRDAVSFPRTHLYSSVWVFTITWEIRNINVVVASGVEKPVAYCTTTVTLTDPTPAPYCWDWILQDNEQCDPGSWSFWNGCNSGCQLMTPDCTLTVTPNNWNIPLNTTINGTKPSWATYLTLDFGDGSPIQNNPTFTLPHTYNSVWTFNLTLTVKNNYNGQTNGVPSMPTNTCTASVTTTQPWSPVPYLLKQQKTWGMTNFTSNQINVENTWALITYKVIFWNSWTVAATWEVWDILPPCVNYLTSSIYLPNWVTYNWPTVSPVNAWNQYMVKYTDFRLQPWQGWYMLVEAQIRWTGTYWTTSCENITSYLNTWYFKFVWWNTLTSEVIAVRPKLSIHKQLLTTWDLTAWSTVAYKITLTNVWSATYHNAYILDIIPNAIQYQTSSIQNIINYSFEEWTTWNNEYYIKYYNFNLNANHSAIVYLTWVLKQWFNFNETTNCAMTSGAIDCEEFPLSPVPYIKKWQKTWGMADFTDQTIQVALWELITYRIDFWNLWNKAATGEVKDILPDCIKYESGWLVGAIWDWPYTGEHTVWFTNIPLSAWQTAHMMVVWRILSGGDCQSTYTYLNTWLFHFVNTPWQNSTVLAERPNITDVEITKEVSPTWVVHSWQVITYTIKYKNKWPEVLQTYTIVDYWPNDKLEFSGVIEPLTPVADTSNISNNIIRWEFDTPLLVNEERQIKIQWIVR